MSSRPFPIKTRSLPPSGECRTRSTKSSVLVQTLLLLWCFTLMVRELGVFSTWGVAPIAVGIFLVITTLGAFGYAIYTAYAEMDRGVVAQIRKDGAARTSSAGKTFNKGDVILRVASGGLKVLHPDEFEERFELDPGHTAPADGFQPYRATGKLWAHEVSEAEVGAFFPAGKFVSAGTLATIKAGDVLMMPFPGGGAVYRLDKQAFEQKYAKAISGDERRGSITGGYIPSQAETLAHWEHKIKTSGAVYHKTASIHARLADEHGSIATIVDGVIEEKKAYAKGDYILVGSRGGRYSMRAVDFSARYDYSNSQPASDPVLAREGFSLYLPTGMVWARQVSAEEVHSFFPIGKFSSKWGGTPLLVEATGYLVMPHPSCGEVYVIKNDLFHSSYARHALHDHIPSEEETLAQWESVLRQDARVCRKKLTVFAKIADQDGTLDEIMQHEEESIEVEIPQQEDEAGAVAMVPLRSGGGAAPVKDANARNDGDTTTASFSCNEPSSSWGAGWLTCVEAPLPGHSESKGDDADD